MRIAIDVNGVLRSTLKKIQQEYEKWYIDNPFLSEEETAFKREVFSDVTTLDLRKHLSFEDNDDLYNFLYREHTMEIFGHAGSVENSSIQELNDIYLDFRDKYDFYIVSDEIGKSKSATLFFLSKFGCLIENVKFYSESTIDSLWDSIDVLLTANPKLLLSKPTNKVLIKYNTLYNDTISVGHEVSLIKELREKIKELYD